MSFERLPTGSLAETSLETAQNITAPDDGISRGGFDIERRPIKILDGLQDEIVIPTSDYGYQMSPIEACTGVPLPILGPRATGKDLHHAFFYKKHYRKELQLRAVRYSRLQLVGKWAHSMYHQHFDGTKFPEDEHEAFRLTILNCAGYVPAYGVHVKPKELVIRPLRSNDRYALRKPHSFTTERYERGKGLQRRAIGQFIMNYALSQNFDALRTLEVEEFLSISQADVESSKAAQERKFQLGMRLTNMALGACVEPLADDFRRARRGNSLRNNLQVSHPWAIAKAQLNHKEPDYYETLEEVLLQRHGAVA